MYNVLYCMFTTSTIEVAIIIRSSEKVFIVCIMHFIVVDCAEAFVFGRKL